VDRRNSQEGFLGGFATSWLPQDGRRENSFGEGGGGGEDAKLKFLKGGRGSTGGTVEIMAPAYAAQRRGGCRRPASLPSSPSFWPTTFYPGSDS